MIIFYIVRYIWLFIKNIHFIVKKWNLKMQGQGFWNERVRKWEDETIIAKSASEEWEWVSESGNVAVREWEWRGGNGKWEWESGSRSVGMGVEVGESEWVSGWIGGNDSEWELAGVSQWEWGCGVREWEWRGGNGKEKWENGSRIVGMRVGVGNRSGWVDE